MKIIYENRTIGEELNYECLYHTIGMAVASSAEEITIDNEREIIDKVYGAVQKWVKRELNVQVCDATELQSRHER